MRGGPYINWHNRSHKGDKHIQSREENKACYIRIQMHRNEILMYLRRNNRVKLEVSFDEPLNTDWDGNELLLSDILGTDEDVIYKDLETEVEISLLKKPCCH